MTTQTKHTPGLLRAIGNPSETDIDGAVEIRCEDETVANAYGTMEISPKAMAAFIVRACNANDDLLDALEAVLNCQNYASVDKDRFPIPSLELRQVLSKCHAAIAKARGE